MSRSRMRALSFMSAAIVGLTQTVTLAQYGNCQTCAPVQPVAQQCAPIQPVAQQCVTAQPVMQTCYQTVPVTTWKKEEVTVQKPVWDVKYVNQPVTEYKPVTETKTANVPTVSYRTVTNYRPVTTNQGYWQTYRTRNCKVSPCEYDKRPGIAGWFNRTSYSFRSSFTPEYQTHRRYVPRTCTKMVAYTQQVPVRGMRQVSYQVTKMVPYQTTRRVAVRKLRYEDQKVVAMKPVTAYRTVPTGTSVAYVGGGTTTAWYGAGTQTAYWGGGYGYGAPQTAYYYADDLSSPATASNREGFDRTARTPRPDPISGERRTRTASNPDADIENAKPFRRDDGASLETPEQQKTAPGQWSESDLDLAALRARRAARSTTVARTSPSVAPTVRFRRPTIVRTVSQPTRSAVAVNGPQLLSQSVAVASTNH